MKVVELPVVDQRSVKRVLDGARAAGLTDIMVIGFDPNGDLWTDVNTSDGGTLLWMLELAKVKLLSQSTKGVVECG